MVSWLFINHRDPSITDAKNILDNEINLAYGPGWGLPKSQYTTAIFKEGRDQSWQHYNITFIDKGIYVIIMTNSDSGEKICKDIREK
jgi:hypothetical protein